MTPMQGKASVVGIHKDLLRRSCLLIVALLLALLAVDGALWIFAPIETDAAVYMSAPVQ